jgi:hypothetical protein
MDPVVSVVSSLPAVQQAVPVKNAARQPAINV